MSASAKVDAGSPTPARAGSARRSRVRYSKRPLAWAGVERADFGRAQTRQSLITLAETRPHGVAAAAHGRDPAVPDSPLLAADRGHATPEPNAGRQVRRRIELEPEAPQVVPDA